MDLICATKTEFKSNQSRVCIEVLKVRTVKIASVGFKYVEALGRVIIEGPYPPSNAIIYMPLQL